MPTAMEMKEAVYHIGKTILRPLYKNQQITCGQYEAILKFVARVMAATWMGNLNAVFEQIVLEKVNAKKAEALGVAPSITATADGNGAPPPPAILPAVPPSPAPAWLVSKALQSPDLADVLLAPLVREALASSKDAQAARVCKAWREGWRRQTYGLLHYVRCCESERPQYVCGGSWAQFGSAPQFVLQPYVTSLPGGGALVTDCDKNLLHWLSPEGKARGSTSGSGKAGSIFRSPGAVALVADGTSVWLVDDLNEVIKLPLDAHPHYTDSTDFIRFHDDRGISDLAVVDDSLLALAHAPCPWETRSPRETHQRGLVSVRHASTGALRYEFGMYGLAPDELFDPLAMAVHGDLLYVTDNDLHRTRLHAAPPSRMTALPLLTPLPVAA